jgi:hypothetical protein
MEVRIMPVDMMSIRNNVAFAKRETAFIDYAATLDGSNEEYAALYSSWRLIEERAHKSSADAGWWTDLETGESIVGKRNVPEMLMLIVSEIAEAMEAYRKNLMDDKLPHRGGVEVELADAVLRIADFGRAYDLDIAGALIEKDQFNRAREDHKIENRRLANGKKF